MANNGKVMISKVINSSHCWRPKYAEPVGDPIRREPRNYTHLNSCS